MKQTNSRTAGVILNSNDDNVPHTRILDIVLEGPLQNATETFIR